MTDDIAAMRETKAGQRMAKHIAETMVKHDDPTDYHATEWRIICAALLDHIDRLEARVEELENWRDMQKGHAYKREYEKMKGERDALRKRIADAPHDIDCDLNGAPLVRERSKCNCWKAGVSDA